MMDLDDAGSCSPHEIMVNHLYGLQVIEAVIKKPGKYVH